MAELTVFAELQKLMGLEQKPGEAAPDFAERLALKGNNLKDEDWESLSEAAQLWVNTALTALEDKDDIPLPDGLIVEEDGEASPEQEAAEEEAQEAAPAKAKKKSSAKKAPVKEAKAKAKPGPKGKFAGGDVVEVLTKSNPYRSGTKLAAFFDLYQEGLTVDEVVSAGIPRYQIRRDEKASHIKISGDAGVARVVATLAKKEMVEGTVDSVILKKEKKERNVVAAPKTQLALPKEKKLKAASDPSTFISALKQSVENSRASLLESERKLALAEEAWETLVSLVEGKEEVKQPEKKQHKSKSNGTKLNVPTSGGRTQRELILAAFEQKEHLQGVGEVVAAVQDLFAVELSKRSVSPLLSEMVKKGQLQRTELGLTRS